MAVVISLVVSILIIAEAWLILRKQGQPGWKSLIPIYGEYCIIAASGAADLFWKQLLASFAGGFLSAISGLFADSSSAAAAAAMLVIALLSLAASIYSLRCLILMNKALARSFGKGTGFAWGLILLGIVFRGILAFSDRKSVV